MNKREIMQRAWLTYKCGPARFQRSFSLCLKTAWEIAKRPQMISLADSEAISKAILAVW
jgi:hypothetical protein